MEYKELSPAEFIAIKDFAEGLKEVFVNFKKNSPDRIGDVMLDYAIKIIDLHLQLKELEVGRYLNNLELVGKK